MIHRTFSFLLPIAAQQHLNIIARFPNLVNAEPFFAEKKLGFPANGREFSWKAMREVIKHAK
jgi:hypothetical protein